MRTKLVAAAIALGAAAAVATPAHALTAGECQGPIGDLSAGTAAAESLTARDRTALLTKVDDAAAKLDAGKAADAFAKLSDYDVKLDALHGAAKPKVSGEDFVLLSGEVGAALGCVAGIGAL